MQWTTTALRTIESKKPQQITLHSRRAFIFNTFGETVYREWLDLDRLLVKFQTLHPALPKVVYEVEVREPGLGGYTYVQHYFAAGANQERAR